MARAVTGTSPGLDRLLRRFPLAVAALDADLQVIFVNEPAQRLLAGALDEAQLGDVAASGNELVPLADGRTLRVTVSPAEGAEPALLVFEDVTAQERRTLAMQEFLRNAAHQLRTPLTAITTAIEVLQSGAKEQPEDRDRFLSHIESHTARLTRIARGLLVLARAESGEAPRLGPVGVRPLLDTLAREARPAAGVDVVVSCAAPVAAMAEPDVLREALSALLENAIEHTSAGTIELGARTVDGWTEITVADSGLGIPADQLGRIFEPFYSTAHAGTHFGLGLAITARAVAAMQGEIEAAANDRGGTTLTIRLPAGGVA